MRLRGFEVAVKNKQVSSDLWELWEVHSLPERATRRSAGFDFYCADSVTIPSIWKQLASAIRVKVLSSSNTNNALCEVVSTGLVDSDKLVSKSHLNKLIESLYVKIDTKFSEVSNLFKPTLVHTGIKAYMQDDEVLYLYNRSSNPKKLGLILANSVGVIDSDYYSNIDNDGEIMFAFYNFLPFDITLKFGDKLGQGVFSKYLSADDGACVTLDNERVGGIGSTDGK